MSNIDGFVNKYYDGFGCHTLTRFKKYVFGQAQALLGLVSFALSLVIKNDGYRMYLYYLV